MRHHSEIKAHEATHPRQIEFGWRVGRKDPKVSALRQKRNDVRTSRYTRQNWVFASLFF